MEGAQDGAQQESYTIYILATRVVVTHEWLVYSFRSNYVTMVTN